MFPPTYKLEYERNEYTQGKDARVPGWTDRILYYSKIPEDLEQKNYDSGINMFGSDHRPVYA